MGKERGRDGERERSGRTHTTSAQGAILLECDDLLCARVLFARGALEEGKFSCPLSLAETVTDPQSCFNRALRLPIMRALGRYEKAEIPLRRLQSRLTATIVEYRLQWGNDVVAMATSLNVSLLSNAITSKSFEAPTKVRSNDSERSRRKDRVNNLRRTVNHAK